MTDESDDRNTDWAAEYLGEGQDILDGAGHHTGDLARADVFFQASAAVSLYEIQAALKLMLPMLERMAHPPEYVVDIEREQAEREAIGRYNSSIVSTSDNSAHRSTSSEE